jgi:Tfp pilus assembly protein PilF
MRWLPSIFRFSSPQARADKLVKRGLSFVRDGKTTEALAVARELHSIRYSGAFEVEAQALDREGSKDEAIAVLRKGLEVAPQAWLNGNLLGNYLSDQGRYDEAFAAYEAAAQAPTANCILIEANYAMALRRAGRDDEARARIAEVLKQPLSNEESELQTFVLSVASDLKL